MTLSEPNKLNWLTKVIRFFLGLSVFIWLLIIAPKLAGIETIGVVMFYSTFPMIVLAIPAALIGLYFIITTKFRFRLDGVLIFILILLLSTLYKFMIPQQPTGDISGETKVEITLLNENKQPLSNVEIDMAEKPGTPPTGGRQTTNSKGIATFYVNPAKYVIYFNQLNFPKDLIEPIDNYKITVEEGKTNTKTIILNFK